MRFSAAMAMALLSLAVPATAQTPPRTTLDQAALRSRAESLIAILGGGGDTASVFTPETLAQLPDAQIRSVATQLSNGLGKPLAIASFVADSPTAAKVTVRYERGSVDLRFATEPTQPYRLIGLLITGTSSAETSIEQIVATLQTLPGVTGLALSKLGDGAPTPVNALKADSAFAIGSAFKLAILSELIRATAAGERRWDDLITLDGKPLPGGFYTQKPAGTTVTIREVAQKMISVSDNSATDILIVTLGREKIEAMLPVIGWHDAARNRPFLGTLEAFKLKGAMGGALGTRWRSLDQAGRRALLAGDVATTPLTAIDPLVFQRGKPVMLDIEWFASPNDLIRTMDWIRRHTESGPAAEARAVLGINPGVGPAIAQRWGYVGFKGGSEPGVIEMTFLLQAKSGAWYALAVAWNNPAAPVEDARFAALVTRAVELIEASR